MKKFISVVLSLVLIFALGVTATACTETEEKGYYYVTYKVDGVQYGKIQKVEQGKSAALYAIPNISPDEGYHYCWQSEDGQYLVDTVFTPSADTKLFLVQVKNPPEPMTHYSITYLVDGEQFGQIQKVAVGRGIIVYDYPTTTPTKGYHYIWISNGVQYEEGTTFTPDRDMALELSEIPNPKEFTVTYKVNGKAFGQEQKVSDGQSLTLYDMPEAFMREGYSYYWKVEGGSRISGKTYKPIDDTIIYLEEVANAGTVNFLICEAESMSSFISGTMQSVTLKTGDSIPAPTFNCVELYEFSGWALIDSYGGLYSPTEQIDKIVIPDNGASITLYAQYERVII